MMPSLSGDRDREETRRGKNHPSNLESPAGAGHGKRRGQRRPGSPGPAAQGPTPGGDSPGTTLPGAGQFWERTPPGLGQRSQSLKARPSLTPCPALRTLRSPGSSHGNSWAGRAEQGRSGVKVKGSAPPEPWSGPGWNPAVGPAPEGRHPTFRAPHLVRSPRLCPPLQAALHPRLCPPPVLETSQRLLLHTWPLAYFPLSGDLMRRMAGVLLHASNPLFGSLLLPVWCSRPFLCLWLPVTNLSFSSDCYFPNKRSGYLFFFLKSASSFFFSPQLFILRTYFPPRLLFI